LIAIYKEKTMECSSHTCSLINQNLICLLACCNVAFGLQRHSFGDGEIASHDPSARRRWSVRGSLVVVHSRPGSCSPARRAEDRRLETREIGRRKKDRHNRNTIVKRNTWARYMNIGGLLILVAWFRRPSCTGPYTGLLMSIYTCLL
jgi:hypothetical protein